MTLAILLSVCLSAPSDFSTPDVAFKDTAPVCEYALGGCVVRGGEGAARYAAAHAEALRAAQPLVVFVKMAERSVPGMVAVRWDDFPPAHGNGPLVVLGTPDGMGRFDLTWCFANISDGNLDHHARQRTGAMTAPAVAPIPTQAYFPAAFGGCPPGGCRRR